MDAKTKADFINSVAGGGNIPCPNCNGLNASSAKFCKFCGTKLPQPAPEPQPIPEPQPVPEPQPIPEPQPVPEPQPIPEPQPLPEPQPIPEPQPAVGTDMPFQEIKEIRPESPAEEKEAEIPFAPASAPQQETVSPFHYEEPASVFAQGLPEWSVEPPEVMVRRKRKR